MGKKREKGKGETVTLPLTLPLFCARQLRGVTVFQ